MWFCSKCGMSGMPDSHKCDKRILRRKENARRTAGCLSLMIEDRNVKGLDSAQVEAVAYLIEKDLIVVRGGKGRED